MRNSLRLAAVGVIAAASFATSAQAATTASATGHRRSAELAHGCFDR